MYLSWHMAKSPLFSIPCCWRIIGNKLPATGPSQHSQGPPKGEAVLQTTCTLNAHYMHTTCTLHAHYMHTLCTLHAHYMHTTCTLHAHYIPTQPGSTSGGSLYCTLHPAYILDSEQGIVDAHYTHTHTHIRDC